MIGFNSISFASIVPFFVGLHYCSICDVKFSFNRHLRSDDHKMFAECLETSPAVDDDQHSLYASTHENEVLIGLTYYCFITTHHT